MSTTGKYIVVFKDTVDQKKIDQVAEDVAQNGGKVHQNYSSTALKGFSATIPETYLTSLQSLQGDEIDYIEPDGTVTTQI